MLHTLNTPGHPQPPAPPLQLQELAPPPYVVNSGSTWSGSARSKHLANQRK